MPTETTPGQLPAPPAYRHEKKPAGVSTIGYEQNTPAEFAARLFEAKIDMLIDARAGTPKPI